MTMTNGSSTLPWLCRRVPSSARWNLVRMVCISLAAAVGAWAAGAATEFGLTYLVLGPRSIFFVLSCQAPLWIYLTSIPMLVLVFLGLGAALASDPRGRQFNGHLHVLWQVGIIFELPKVWATFHHAFSLGLGPS